jgi:hypothetical protein
MVLARPFGRLCIADPATALRDKFESVYDRHGDYLARPATGWNHDNCSESSAGLIHA